MLTEHEVARTWHQLTAGSDISEERLERAELLLENLSPESPLRHRLTAELDEIRQLCERRSGVV